MSLYVLETDHIKAVKSIYEIFWVIDPTSIKTRQ